MNVSMQNIIFTGFCLIGMLLGHAQVELKQQTIDSLMSLDFDSFDQNMEGGWRYYSNKEDYKTAAHLLKLYLQKHVDAPSSQQKIMKFHCGQMLALMNENEAAIPFMEASKKEENDFMHWNVYVDGTIAFLRQDRVALTEKRMELAERSMLPEHKNRNLNVLKLLEKNFGKTYREALEPE